jgi:hypothetical protein
MATATIVNVWKDARNAYVAATVPEGGAAGTVEYIAAAPLSDGQGNPKGTAQLKADLTAALTLVRNAQLAAVLPVAGISGTVTV